MSDLNMRVRIVLQRLAGVGRAPLRLSENTFAMRLGMAKLPALVRRQRRLERVVARHAKAVVKEKATRDAIDALLLKQGLAAGQGVTCFGYDVVHNERAGQRRISADKLRASGVSELDILLATVEGERASFATVRPMKGAEVAAA